MIDLDMIQFKQDLVAEVRSMRPLGDDTTTKVEATPNGSVISAIITETPEAEGEEAGASIWPAKIQDHFSSVHYVDIYADGYGESPTADHVALASIMNLAVDVVIPDGTELIVILAGEEYIGLTNGIF